MLKSKITKSLLLSTLLVLTACGGGGGSSSSDEPSSNLTDNSSEENKPPIVQTEYNKKVQINMITKITANARDVDGTIVSYEWTKGEDVIGTTLDIEYMPTVLGKDILTLTVMDNDGDSSSDTIELEVISEEIIEYVGDPLPF